MVGSAFKEVHVRQIVGARDSIFSEMCQELNITNYHHIHTCHLSKQTVTKDKLVGLLETVTYPRLS